MNSKNYKFTLFIKKILVILIIITTLFVYIPMYYSYAVDEDYKEEPVEELGEEDEDEDLEGEVEEDEDDKEPALVPLAFDSIISKFIETGIYAGGSNSGASGGIITNYEEKGDGWASVTEVQYPNGTIRKYRNYQQGVEGLCSYYDKPYWEGIMQKEACGPTAVATVLSGYGYDAGPAQVVDAMEVKSSGQFEYLMQPLKDIGNIDSEKYISTGTSEDLQRIRKNFSEGRPVIVHAPGHYIVLLGEDQNGKLIVSDPASKFYSTYFDARIPSPDNLEDFVYKGMIAVGYILITSDGNASSSSTSSATKSSTLRGVSTNSTTNTTNTTNTTSTASKTTSSTEKSSTKTTGTGEAKIEKQDVSNGGYESIFTSGTTGRQFKEFKQNSANYSYPNLEGTYWGQECTTVSLAIVGSGYKDINMQAIAEKLNNNGGNTNFTEFLSSWTDQNIQQYTISSKEDLVDKLSQGYVGTVYDFAYSSRGHMVAMLDISKDKTQVYISNPDVYQPGDDGIGQGWTSIDKFYESISKAGGDYNVPGKTYTFFATNDGNMISYSSSGGSKSSSSSKLNMSSNIIQRDENDKSKGYKIKIDLDKEIDDVLDKLSRLNFNMSGYLHKKNQKESLKKIIKACIVTQYPDLRSAKEIADEKSEIPPDETQGCIRVKRYTNDSTVSFSSGKLSNPYDSEENGGGMFLEYMPVDDLKKMINDGDRGALNYFSMDSSNNIVVAGWETMEVSVNIQQTNADDPEVGECPTDIYGEVEYTPKAKNYQKLTVKTVNYLNQISNYTLPFSFFWTLLVYGHDEDFINDFADLVISSDIVLGCNDAVTTTTTDYTQTMSKVGIAEISSYYDVPASERGKTSGKIGETKTKTIRYDFLITETDILKNDNPVLKVKYADIWTAVYNKDYKIDIKESEEKGDKVEFEDKITGRDYHQKVVREDGTVEYIRYGEDDDGRPKDEKLADKVDDAIDETFEENIKNLEKEAEKKNKVFEYRYNIFSKFIQENNILDSNILRLYATKDDLKTFIGKKEVQNYIINCIINYTNDDLVKKLFSNTQTTEYTVLLSYAKEVNSNDAVKILKSTEIIVTELIKDYVKDKGGTNSDLYKQLTKNGTEIKLCYTAPSLQASTVSVETRDADKTEEYKKDIKKEEIVDVPAEIRWKDDKNAKENSFVKLLSKSKSAKGNLWVVNAWFFESVENTATIADLLDVLKYLFQKVYNSDYGISPEDAEKLLEMFDPKKMASFKKKSTAAGTIVGGASYASLNITDEELHTLYQLMTLEAGGGTHEQIMRETCVVFNRVLSSAFPNTLRDVIYEPGQFQPVFDGGIEWVNPPQDIIDGVNDALKTGDITGGAIGFQTIDLYESQYPGQTAETPIELYREYWPGGGGSAVYFTTATIQAELAQFK